MKHLIAFDISNGRKRNRVVKVCLSLGFRVQKSVFEVFVEPGQLKGVENRLESLINPKTDSVRIYPLDKTADDAIRIIGCGKRVERKQCVIL